MLDNNDYFKFFNSYIKDVTEVKNKFFEENYEEVVNISKLIRKKFDKDNKMLICGNGGSAADSQHFAAELVGKFSKDSNPFPAISLTTDTSILTAISNDYSFEDVFYRQVNALLDRKDILFCISTSGNSENILKALRCAKNKKATTISLTGGLVERNKMRQYSDYFLCVKSFKPYYVQEAHLSTYHILAYLIENM